MIEVLNKMIEEREVTALKEEREALRKEVRILKR